ncbi:hypothetical protein PF002_g3948 [Phytophthora fragariae]|nr:hypothetical protein PF006_g3138 [Phytophthora fragariae]KAE9252141.1 hypothetical protein PF002_g3948 [Phytophthora fragariae]KAE9284237.1 hypothetical protein PF001_g22484 [Phytophthora fragariae]
MAREDYQLLMEDMKFFIIVKSHLVPCVGCTLTRPHKMCYQLLECSSKTCNAATPYDACPWNGKVLTCQEFYRVMIMECGASSVTPQAPSYPATQGLRERNGEMAMQGLKPARIRMGIIRWFGLTEEVMPTLGQVQRFVRNFNKKELHRTDDYEDVLDQIGQLAYGPAVADTQPFSFGWERDSEGKPNVGNGSNENPFLVGLTTKCLLRNADRDPSSFVFHMDGTFKLNQVAYPVVVCGVSDRGRSFHLVAIFITPQRLEGLYGTALSALRRMFTAVTSMQLLLKYVLADAEAEQLNAVTQVFGMDSELTYLMCIYHVMAKVHKMLKALSGTLRERVVADI